MDTIKKLPIINVLGCCVSRDAVELIKDECVVGNYAPFNSAYSVYNGAALELDTDRLISIGMTPFIARVVTLDAAKRTVDYIKEKRSDWLLLDIADSRLSVLVWHNSNIYLTYNSYVQKFLPDLRELFPAEDPQLIEVWKIPEEALIDSVDKMLDELLKIYPANRIILNEFYRVPEFLTAEGFVKKFSKVTLDLNNKWNPILERLNQHCEKRLVGCHVIRSLKNALSYEKHKWGLMPLHYCSEYYEYIGKCLEAIIKYGDGSMVEDVLDNLNLLYNEKFITIKMKAENKSLLREKNKWGSYSCTFRDLVIKNLLAINENWSLNLSAEILRKGYKHLAIFGDTEITKVLCKVLADDQFVAVDYIVESAAKPFPGIKTIDRNASSYPDCDMMLIADIYFYNDVKAKLEKMNLSFPFYNAVEFIRSLPIMDEYGIVKLKDQFMQSNEQSAKEREKNKYLSARVAMSDKKEVELCNQLSIIKQENIDLQKQFAVLNKTINNLVTEQAQVTDKLNVTESQLKSIRESISYRLGRVVTFVPRKLRNVLKK